MIEIIKKINETNLTPNEYLLLYALFHGVELKNIDIEVEKNNLTEKGHLTSDGKLASTELVSMELEDKALLAHVRSLRRIFPAIILPTGLPARGKESQVRLKLKTFLQTFNYDWNLIYEATERYVHRYANQGYKYMQNASNFVLDKNGDSTLALECEILEDSAPQTSDTL